MARTIVPINQLDHRLQEHGRIRIGEKGAKGAPKKIDVFRFTSDDRDAIAEIAALYGGTVAAWNQQWEVKTAAKAIPVILPPDPLGGTPVYELWSGGGCLRRCDGELCLVPQQTAGGAEMVETPCVCDAKGQLECKPKTRLTVILPEIRFGGGWRLESGGWNVAHEMPGMVAMIEQLQVKGLSRAELALEERVSKFAGQTRKFVVPVVRPAISVNLMIEGQGTVKALGMAPMSAAEEMELVQAGVPVEELHGDFVKLDGSHGDTYVVADDWDIVDAELVGPEPSGYTSATTPAPEPIVPVDDEIVPEAVLRKRKRMHVLTKELGMGLLERHALVLRITSGRAESSNDLDEGGLDVMIAALDAMKKAEAFFDGVDEKGWAIVSKR